MVGEAVWCCGNLKPEQLPDSSLAGSKTQMCFLNWREKRLKKEHRISERFRKGEGMSESSKVESEKKKLIKKES